VLRAYSVVVSGLVEKKPRFCDLGLAGAVGGGHVGAVLIGVFVVNGGVIGFGGGGAGRVVLCCGGV